MPEILDQIVIGLAWACLIGGAVLAIIGGIGLHRFPDIFTRMHAVGVIDTGGAGLLLIGLILRSPDWLTAVKLVLILFFLFFTSPTATHAVARAATTGRVEPWTVRGGGG